MTELVIAFMAGGGMAAVVSGIFGLIMYKSKRRDTQRDAECDRDDVIMKALRYIMLYVIQERAEKYIYNGCVTIDERRALHKWHTLYHDGLGGNGDADELMADVNNLPLRNN